MGGKGGGGGGGGGYSAAGPAVPGSGFGAPMAVTNSRATDVAAIDKMMKSGGNNDASAEAYYDKLMLDEYGQGPAIPKPLGDYMAQAAKGGAFEGDVSSGKVIHPEIVEAEKMKALDAQAALPTKYGLKPKYPGQDMSLMQDPDPYGVNKSSGKITTGQV
jgi:hypothetical protein